MEVGVYASGVRGVAYAPPGSPSATYKSINSFWTVPGVLPWS